MWSNTCYEFFYFWMILLLLSLVETPIDYNTHLETLIYFASSPIIQHDQKSSFVRGSAKVNLLSKIHLPKTVTQWWILLRKCSNWINFGYGNMSSKGSYPSSSLNILYDSVHIGFTPYLTWFNAIYWANLSLLFAFSEGVVSSLNDHQQFYHQ